MQPSPADQTTATQSHQALLVVDPYNDFLSRVGKAWPLTGVVAKRVGTIANIARAINASRDAGVAVVYAPHHQYTKGQPTVRFPNPTQLMAVRAKFFARSKRGSRFLPILAPAPGEFVAGEHPVSSGFTDTGLHEHLQDSSVTHLVVTGMLTNTCIESTVRAAVDRGYHVTVVSDAFASWTHEDHDASIEGSLPMVTHAVHTTDSYIASLPEVAR
jgi:nicotinamidase-related amidase